MSEIPPIGSAGAAAPGRTDRGERAAQAPAAPARGHDKVEFSQHAQLLNKLAKLPEIRSELVDRVRQEIATNTYESSEKLDTAIRNLAEEL